MTTLKLAALFSESKSKFSTLYENHASTGTGKKAAAGLIFLIAYPCCGSVTRDQKPEGESGDSHKMLKTSYCTWSQFLLASLDVQMRA